MIQHHRLAWRARQWRPRRMGVYGAIAVAALMGSCAPAPGCTPVPPPNPTPTTTLPPSTASSVQTQVVQIVNQHRAAAGLPALAVNTKLTAAAQSHSADQAARRTMTHTGANGSNPGQRMTAAGYVWRAWGENVAAGQRSATDVMSAWMGSAPHKANILSANVTEIGVAAVASSDGTLYWTMDLGRR